MKTATVKELKSELQHRSSFELSEIVLTLSKFKKENKELLTYLLFERENEDLYIETTKEEIEEQFAEINTSSAFYIKKSTRKILRFTKTRIRYSKKPATEVELLLHFCKTFKALLQSTRSSTVLLNIYTREMNAIKKKLEKLHPDLQYDYLVVWREILNS
jgi:hypothetical protein